MNPGPCASSPINLFQEMTGTGFRLAGKYRLNEPNRFGCLAHGWPRAAITRQTLYSLLGPYIPSALFPSQRQVNSAIMEISHTHSLPFSY